MNETTLEELDKQIEKFCLENNEELQIIKEYTRQKQELSEDMETIFSQCELEVVEGKKKNDLVAKMKLPVHFAEWIEENNISSETWEDLFSSLFKYVDEKDKKLSQLTDESKIRGLQQKLFDKIPRFNDIINDKEESVIFGGSEEEQQKLIFPLFVDISKYSIENLHKDIDLFLKNTDSYLAELQLELAKKIEKKQEEIRQRKEELERLKKEEKSVRVSEQNARRKDEVQTLQLEKWNPNAPSSMTYFSDSLSQKLVSTINEKGVSIPNDCKNKFYNTYEYFVLYNGTIGNEEKVLDSFDRLVLFAIYSVMEENTFKDETGKEEKYFTIPLVKKILNNKSSNNRHERSLDEDIWNTIKKCCVTYFSIEDKEKGFSAKQQQTFLTSPIRQLVSVKGAKYERLYFGKYPIYFQYCEAHGKFKHTLSSEWTEDIFKQCEKTQIVLTFEIGSYISDKRNHRGDEIPTDCKTQQQKEKWIRDRKNLRSLNFADLKAKIFDFMKYEVRSSNEDELPLETQKEVEKLRRHNNLRRDRAIRRDIETILDEYKKRNLIEDYLYYPKEDRYQFYFDKSEYKKDLKEFNAR